MSCISIEKRAIELRVAATQSLELIVCLSTDALSAAKLRRALDGRCQPGKFALINGGRN